MSNPDDHLKDELQESKLPVVQQPSDYWRNLQSVKLLDSHLTRNRIVSAECKDPAYRVFDMLRTRLIRALRDHGWTRVAITSPTRGCGKSFVAANLAIALSRLEETRTVLLDLDLRSPSLANTLGVTPQASIQDYLAGRVEPEDFLLRARENLALGLNGEPVANAAELFLETMSADVLDELQDILCPDVVLLVLPPALHHDDVLAILPNVDGVLMVAGGGVTTADDITQVERLLGDIKPLLGVVLNKADGTVSV